VVSEPIGNCDRDAGNCPVARLTAFSGFVPKSGWELFSYWDGKWYVEIANLGYSYADDEQQHSVAFYPLFPLSIGG
jgi:hypothetical protein